MINRVSCGWNENGSLWSAKRFGEEVIEVGEVKETIFKRRFGGTEDERGTKPIMSSLVLCTSEPPLLTFLNNLPDLHDLVSEPL
jgi:hypothetical protein